jgi:hypothetical protein
MLSSLFKKVLVSGLFIIICRYSHGQTPVFANIVAGDSTDLAVKSLFKELDKAGFGNYKLSPVAEFKGKGILLLQPKKTGNSGITLPTQLKTYGPEGIYIKGNEQSVIIAGNSALALQEAVFIYLEQLGFRYLMPGSIWEVIPSLNKVYKDCTVLTQPDFEYREITNGHGYYDKKNIEKDYVAWSKANRFGGAFPIQVGHAYDEIMLGNAETFRQHPEYFAQTVKKGELPATPPKFNVSNKDLVQLVIRNAFDRVTQLAYNKLGVNMVSMEPSDGPGYCNTPACKAIGGPSEQTYYLSNAVIRELRKKYPGIWVGLLAYSEHMLPPALKVEPNTFVMVTTAFNPSGLTTIELLSKWKQKVSKTGVYEYISVYEWDNDLPGMVRAAKSAQLQKAIQAYYNAGTRVFLAESTMGWVSRGPGQYVIGRLLWDRNSNIETIKSDFFNKAYGNVASLMRRLYDDWENYPHKIAMDNDIANWLAWTQEAYDKTTSPLIRQRIDQVKMYLHYVVLYRNLKMNPTEENMQTVMRYAYRNFENPAFATLPTLVSLPNYSGFPQIGFYSGAEQKYKTNNRPSSSSEITADFQQDIQSSKRTPEVSMYKSTNTLVKLDAITKINDLGYKATSHAYWGKTEFVIRINKKDQANWLEFTSGISAVQSVLPVSISVYPVGTYTEAAVPVKPLLRLQQTKDAVKEKFSLSSLAPGLYTVRVEDQMKMFILEFGPAIDYSIVLNASEKLLTSSAAGVNNFFFYVPKGVKSFRVNKSVIVKLLSPMQRWIDHSNNKDEVFTVDVKPGEEGLWIVNFQAGNLYIDGVPPYLGTDPYRMLVPSYLKK